MGKLIPLTDKAFGAWTVLGRAPATARGVTRWMCRCQCGTERAVEASSLRDGQSTCCGCQKELRAGGRSKTPEYRSWNSMKQRCSAVGRYAGMTIDPRWTGPSGFAHFLADMGPRPPGTTLDRIDGKLGYSPTNCRWASKKEQTANRRNARHVLLDGEPVLLHYAIKLMAKRMRAGVAAYEIFTVDSAVTRATSSPAVLSARLARLAHPVQAASPAPASAPARN